MDSTIEDDSHKPLLLNSPTTTAGTVASIFCSRNPVIHSPDETAGDDNSSSKVSSNSFQANDDEQLKDILTKKHSISRELHNHPQHLVLVFLHSILFSSGCLGVDSLSVEELKEYREFLLLHIYNASETLVGLLQDRCRLNDEVHFRLISIEQLHRLLEARCFFRGLSTGLIS